MTEYHFCTYFDRNYCEKGLALYQSIEKNIGSFKIYILCLDEETYAILNSLDLQSAELIQLKDLEYRDVLFYNSKQTRSLIEYYFTCTPVFILDILNQHPEISIITYLDADTYLFGSVEPAYEEMAEKSILIVEHRFPECLQRYIKFGRFNIGYLSFRNNDEGKGCLQWWRTKCIEWCYDYLDGDRFADQKYLDQWPNLFLDLKILDHKGINIAPWNVLNYCFSKDTSGQYFVDDIPILLIHFHGIKELFTFPLLVGYDIDLSNKIGNYRFYDIGGHGVLQEIYRNYLLHLLKCRSIIRQTCGDSQFYGGSIRINESAGKGKNSGFITKLKNIGFRLKQLLEKIYNHDIIVVSVYK